MADYDYERYGWMVNEKNLSTLPDTAPQAIKDLVRWQTLEGRRSSLEEYLGLVTEDERIHGKFWHIGAWTHRMSHSNPNSANISSVWDEGRTPTNAVEEVKAKYDSRMRALFHAGGEEDEWLVGTDASGIQLRVLTHYLKSPEYRDAILKGNSADGTDIHSVNRDALGLSHLVRDDAKTFIYAWLLGASIPKIREILNCSMAQAKTAETNFITRTHGLKALKEGEVKRDAMRGYFIGLDGRTVHCDSEHLMLAGYLQNGESVIMKMATLLWYKWAKERGINFRLVNFVHDEWQVIVKGRDTAAETLGRLQRQALEQVGRDLNLFCPLAGETNIGRNWKETH